jgi:hypothetical protein
MSISRCNSASSIGDVMPSQAGARVSRVGQLGTCVRFDHQLLSPILESPHKQTVVHAFAQRAKHPVIRRQLNTGQDAIVSVLQQQGLPEELAEEVLARAGYGCIVMQLQALLNQAICRVDRQLSPDLPASVRLRQIANVIHDELSPQQSSLHPLAVHSSQSAQAIPLTAFAFQENETVLKQIVEGFVTATPALVVTTSSPKWAGVSQSAMLKLSFEDQLFFLGKFKTHQLRDYQRGSLEAAGDAVLIHAALAYQQIQTVGEKPSFASAILNLLASHHRDSHFFMSLENHRHLAPLVHSLNIEIIMGIEETLSRMRARTPSHAR